MSDVLEELLECARRADNGGGRFCVTGDGFRHAAKEVARLRALTEWRDISSAPRDGTDILVYCADTGEQFVAFKPQWDNGNGWRYARTPAGVVVCEPTHWRPLPQSPEDA